MLSTRSPNLTSTPTMCHLNFCESQAFFQVWVRDALHDPRNLPPSRGLTWWALRGFNGRPLLGMFLVLLVQPLHLHLLNKSASTQSFAFKLFHLRFHCWLGSKIDQKHLTYWHCFPDCTKIVSFKTTYNGLLFKWASNPVSLSPPINQGQYWRLGTPHLVLLPVVSWN